MFEHIDQPERLSAHMGRKSWQIGGMAMAIETDAREGRAIGSHIRFVGRMMGAVLQVECEVVQRDPPTYKAWQTVNTPRLLVIGSYRMSVTIEADGGLCRVVIDIDYELAPSWWWRWLGPAYARWCVRQIARDLLRHFENAAVG